MNSNQGKKAGAKDETVNLFSELVHRFFPFWPVFLLAIIICFTVAYLKLRYATPMYRANATIMLKDEETGVESVISALEGSQSKKNVENEIEIIKSRKLMEEVVIDLGLYAQIFMPGKVRHLYAYKNSPLSFNAIEPDKINSTGLINFTYLPHEMAIELNGMKYALEDTVNTPYGKFRLNYHRDHDVPENRQYMVKFDNVPSMAKGLLGNFSINTGSKQSTILNLGLNDPVPERAVDILNQLIQVYNKAGINDKNTMAANTLEFIENRLALITLELTSIEGDIESFKSQEGIVNISSEGSAFLSSVQSSDKQLAEVRIQLSVLEQIEKYIVNKIDMPGTVPATLGISDPILMQLLNKLNDAELQLGRLKRTGAENSPAILTLQSQIAQLKPSILENIRNLRQNLEATEAKIQSESNKYSSLLRSMPRKERKLLDISRQQDVKQSIYTFLLEKREETALSYASAAPDGRLINPAEATGYPVSPVKTSMYLFALAIGLLTGVGFVMIREKLIKQIMFRSELEKATDAPVLAEIILNKEKESIVIGEGKRSVIAEQLRSLRTSLGFIGNSDKKNKTVLITSSVSGDGKSFIGINLSISLAMTGKKVLLLELDLRKPKIAAMLKIDNSNGITNYMAGNISADRIIKKISHIPNFNVISAGSIPPNPTELIMNGKLENLMKEFKEEYDYIILDTPPLGMVTDAKLINVYADICLYIVRHHHTPKNYLNYINQLFVNRELNNLYLVFNGIKERGVFGSNKNYGYGYGYGHGFGYGYGEPESGKKQKGFSWLKKTKSKNNN